MRTARTCAKASASSQTCAYSFACAWWLLGATSNTVGSGKYTTTGDVRGWRGSRPLRRAWARGS